MSSPLARSNATAHHSPSQPPKASPLGTALRTGRSLVLLQLLSRLFTFSLNQALVRIAPPEVFGTAAIQFDLIASTILFLSREGIRNALLRRRVVHDGPAAVQSGQSSEGAGKTQLGKPGKDVVREKQAAALATIPFYLGLLVSFLTTSLYFYTLPPSTLAQRDFSLSLALYVAAALLELLIEPLYIRALRSDPPNVRARVQAEGGMAIVKAIVTVGVVLGTQRAGVGRALLAFALGQLGGAAWLAARYVYDYEVDELGWVTVPKKHSAPRFDPQTSSLAIANTRQSVIKHLLTESNRIVVGRICPLDEQGGYAVALNYGAAPAPFITAADSVGSLVTRILFQPIEETLLLHFSSGLSDASTSATLYTALHTSAHLLLLLPSFLPPLFPAIIPFLLPARYRQTSAPRTLETYLRAYLPLLSLNGIIEAFHTASATPAEVRMQARWMIASSGVFVASLWGMLALEATGREQALIYADCCAMMLRIGYAWRHARRFFSRSTDRQQASEVDRLFDLKSLAPRMPVWSAVLFSGAFLRGVAQTQLWQRGWVGWVEYVGIGGLLGLGNVALIAWIEGLDVKRLLGKRKVA